LYSRGILEGFAKNSKVHYNWQNFSDFCCYLKILGSKHQQKSLSSANKHGLLSFCLSKFHVNKTAAKLQKSAGNSN
jgi:hypothetical protein